ncbi:PTS cellobiose transporter subunit IIC [Candidatus Enterococcus lemimoniae]|uniref:Permease IIC component n=1 Tax=Candidatus Enterococcus lemimoniae TaxID=1834167 RepID=A0ABZ2TA91_9ENTE|nr:PTS cellobiose transporter subunit IIC [Enterococcus sp. 12C11_DIV0727]OTO70336.1 PTS system, cellobiose-specific IIC component [Enterococcus sp. 12C11_DIV0727]
MNTFLEKLQAKIGPVAYKLDSNRYLSAIKNGFFVAMPLLIIGSMFLLVTQLPIKPYIQFMESVLGKDWMSLFLQVNNMTMNAMTLFVILGIASEMAKYYSVDRGSTQAIALVGFLILTPITATENGSFLPLSNFGASGLFVGMITAILAAEIFRWVVQKGWTIKMPESVPSNVAKSFSALIPGFFVVIIFNLIRIGFTFTSYETAQNFIFEVLQTPLLALGSSLPATLIILLFEALLWSFGIHGSNIVGAVMQPIWIALTVENAQAFAAGEPLPNIVNYQFYSNFVKLGGSSATIGLAIACLFFAKSVQFKTLGKLSFAPAIFNINEPLVFGIPIVLNPMMLIPFVIAPLLMCILAYTAMATGIVPLTNGVNLPWTMPPVIAGLMVSGWRGAVLQIVQILLSFGLYYPFFKMEDLKAYKVEMEGVATSDKTLEIEITEGV